MRYWIGGSPCAGKSSIAALLSTRYGLPHVEIDALAPPRPVGLSKCSRLAQPPSWQVSREIEFYRAQFDRLVFPDAGIVEGADLLPELLSEVPSRQAIWIIPTPDFQVRHYTQREWAAAYVADCPDPAQAFDNWMRRDILFADHVRTQAGLFGGKVVVVDGSRSVEDTAAEVADHFGLSPEPLSADRAEIAGLVRTFFAAFTSGPDSAARLDALRAVFLPEAVIVRTCGGEPAVYGVDSFIAPRQALLSGGTLTDFREWELSGRTEIFGDIAQHFCSYAKSGVQDGIPFTGRGMKTLQFVRTVAGWRISAAAWDDEREGLTVTDR